MSVNLSSKLPRPPGHHTVTPSCVVHSAAKVIDFVQSAFGGELVERYDGPGGAVMHAELRLGDSIVMIGEPMPGGEAMPASLSFYVDTGAGVDQAYKRALGAGATSVTEPTNQFYGYRSACVRDLGGNRWTICAVIEELSREEISHRMAAQTRPG